MNIDKMKKFVVKHRAIIAVGTVAVATVAAVVIDVVMRDNEPFEFENAKNL